MDRDHNLHVIEEIKTIAMRSQYFRDNLVDLAIPTQFRTKDFKRIVEKVIRNQFNHLRREHRKSNLPVAAQTALKISKKKNSRIRNVSSTKKRAKNTLPIFFFLILILKQKLTRRKKAFDTLLATGSITDFGTEDDCKSLLKMDYMSEEEDLEVIGSSNVATSFKVLTPLWRSEKVNNI